jgi:hypothetical protein
MAEVNFLVKKGLTVPKGSASTPSVIFDASDPNTGLYSPGADQVAVATNGAGRVFVDASGRIGIAGSPSASSNTYLQVGYAGIGSDHVAYNYDSYFANNLYKSANSAWSRISTRAGGLLRIEDDTFTYSTADSGTAGASATLSERLRITSAGLVGIGTSSPSALLHCFSPDSVNTTAYLQLTNSSGGSGLYRNLHIDGFHPNGASSWKGIDITPTQATTAPMTGIDMSWNQVYAEGRGVNINFSKNTHSGGGAGIGVFSRVIATGTADLAYEAIGGWFVTDKGVGALDPYTSYTLKVENRSTINNTNLTAFYTDSSTIRGSIYYDRTNNALALSGSNAFRIDTNGSSRLFVNSSGNVGIGTSAPTQRLTVFNPTLGVPATSGTTQTNGAFRIGATGTSGVLDFGIGAAGTNQWIQSTDSNNLSLGYVLLLNPNGGNVGIGTTSPSASALLDVTSTTAGFLPPRMTTAQRDAISSPAAGLMVYNTSTNKLNFYNGTAWEAVTSA